MKKKIFVIIILCVGVVLGLCCFNKSDEKAKDINGKTISIKDFVGTWEVQGNNEITLSNGKTYKINNFIISEMVSPNQCVGVCPENSAYYYKVDNKLYSNLTSLYNDISQKTLTLCVQLVNKNTLKQVSCDVLKNEVVYDGAGITTLTSLEDFNIIFKKKSNEIDENLRNTFIFELKEENVQNQ